MSLSITTSASDGRSIVSAVGEVDVSNASQLREALDHALATRPKTLECDLSQVPYIDSTGIGVLVGVAHRGKEAGSRFVVSKPQKNVARVLGLLGVSEELNIEQ